MTIEDLILKAVANGFKQSDKLKKLNNPRELKMTVFLKMTEI